MATALSNSGKGFHVSNDTDLFIDDSLWIPCNNVPQNTPRVELTPWKCGCCSATASSLIGSFIEGSEGQQLARVSHDITDDEIKEYRKSEDSFEQDKLCYVCNKSLYKPVNSLFRKGWRYEALVSRYWDDRKYCPKHFDDGTPVCDFCRHMKQKTDEGWLHEPGHHKRRGHTCRACQKICINDMEAAKLLYKKVMESKRNEKGQQISKTKVTHISILRGMPSTMTEVVLAHEVLHAWMRLTGFPSCKPFVEEGLCEFMAMTWLQQNGPSQDTWAWEIARVAGQNLRENKDPVYGDGYRAVQEACRTHSLKEVLAAVKDKGTLPH